MEIQDIVTRILNRIPLKYSEEIDLEQPEQIALNESIELIGDFRKEFDEVEKMVYKHTLSDAHIFEKGKWYWGGLYSEGDVWIPLYCIEDGKLKTLDDGRVYSSEEIGEMTIREAMLPKHI